MILDRNGHLLPGEDIDTVKLGPLIRITGTGLDQPATDNRPGRVWRSSAPAAEASRLERCVREWQGSPGFSRKRIEPGWPPRSGHSAC